jgi:hypothetical protein
MSANITTQTFRLPQPGDSDPHFGFSRSFCYVGEQRGYWKLIRIRDGGKKKGVTLIPYEQIAAFVRRQAEAQNDTKRHSESP